MTGVLAGRVVDGSIEGARCDALENAVVRALSTLARHDRAAALEQARAIRPVLGDRARAAVDVMRGLPTRRTLARVGRYAVIREGARHHVRP